MQSVSVVGVSLGDTRLFSSSLLIARPLCRYYSVKVSCSASIANVVAPCVLSCLSSLTTGSRWLMFSAFSSLFANKLLMLKLCKLDLQLLAAKLGLLGFSVKLACSNLEMVNSLLLESCYFSALLLCS